MISTQRLGGFRILFCFGLVLQALQVSPYKAGPYHYLPSFELLNLNIISLESIPLIQYLYVIGLTMSTLGIFTRLSLVSAALFHFLFYGLTYGYTYNPIFQYISHAHHIGFFVLLILSATPSVKNFSIDQRYLKAKVTDDPHWFNKSLPAMAIVIALGFVYLLTAIAKLNDSGWAWVSENFLLKIYFYLYLYKDNPLALQMASLPKLCYALGFFTIVWELLFLPLMFVRRICPIVILIGIGFHIAIWVTMDINFITRSLGLTYLIFIDWDSLLLKLRRKSIAS
jgi:hypothetical protein